MNWRNTSKIGTRYLLLLLFLLESAHADPQLGKLKVADGFQVSTYAFPVANARALCMGPKGVIFVGSRGEGKVYALIPDPKNPAHAKIQILARDLDQPAGVAFKDGDLYVSTTTQILRYRAIMSHLEQVPEPEKFGPAFPEQKDHGWKFIAFGPDGWLYVPVGAPCNICEFDPKTHAGIFRLSPDGKRKEQVALGVRNTVGFDWQPESHELWFSDNGRDMLGDDLPADEINQLKKVGENFGFPYCHGRNLPDPEFAKGHKCSEFSPPAFELPAHVAPLGLRFIRSTKGLQHSILVAEHGSWNRSSPIGYQVLRLRFNQGRVSGAEPFLSGFLQNGGAWGRPVDVLEAADGTLFVSDDTADAVYRIVPKAKRE